MDVSDATGLSATAAAYALYQKPGVLHGVAKWDGNTKSASERLADAAKTEKKVAPAKHAFDPFDQKSWWKKAEQADKAKATDSPKATDAAKAPDEPKETMPAPTTHKYGFNPFDQASWWKQTTGTGVDVSV
jgi:hypothetical protein